MSLTPLRGTPRRHSATASRPAASRPGCQCLPHRPIVSVPARSDLVKLKLLAAVDEGVGSPHVHDLVLMKVTDSELHAASGLVQTRFPSGVCPGLDEVVTAVKEAIGE